MTTNHSRISSLAPETAHSSSTSGSTSSAPAIRRSPRPRRCIPQTTMNGSPPSTCSPARRGLDSAHAAVLAVEAVVHDSSDRGGRGHRANTRSWPGRRTSGMSTGPIGWFPRGSSNASTSSAGSPPVISTSGSRQRSRLWQGPGDDTHAPWCRHPQVIPRRWDELPAGPAPMPPFAASQEPDAHRRGDRDPSASVNVQHGASALPRLRRQRRAPLRRRHRRRPLSTAKSTSW